MTPTPSSRFRLPPALALAAIAQAALALSACTPQVVKDSAPPIRQTIGKEKAPSQDELPIIKSENIAPDAQKAADNYRELLKLKPDAATQTESTRRLADLQVQMADAGGSTPESEQRLRESMKLYNQLLAQHPNDPDNARIYYQLARAQQNIGEPEAAIATLKQLTDRLPESKLAGDAHFRRAELLFTLKRYHEAEDEYHVVMAMKDGTPFFEQAQYKYGWSLYKQSKYDPAISTFIDILDRELPTGEVTDPDAALAGVSKGKFDLAKDSLRVIVLSLTTLGGGEALNDYLASHSDPRFYPLLYTALGDAMLEKRRYTDAAKTSAAFIERYPQSPLAPAFQARVIAAYDAGGFDQLSLKEKERYVATYDPAAPYWAGKPATPEVMKALRVDLEDIAKYYHAQAQQELRAAQDAHKTLPQPPAGFAVAAKSYRRIIELYPQDPKLPDINFLLGDALLDGGHTLEAAKEYSKTAYGYRPHTKAPEAAFAAVQAYEQYATEVPKAQRPQALQMAIDESLKLADTYPAHVKRNAVLTQAAEDLYELKQYDKAITVADRVIKAQGNVTPEQQRIAWSVTGNSQFALTHYPQAESAFSEQLKLTAANDPGRADVVEQLAASIYKQGEAARDAGDMDTAAQNFLRVGKVTPNAKIRATADYDGAAALIAMQAWGRAAAVLENFRQLFPDHKLIPDVDKKLAVAYQKDNRPLQAAPVYGRIARRNSESAQTREEAAWLSATLYEQGKAPADARGAYTYYVQNFPASFDRNVEARAKLVDYARSSGDAAALSTALRDQIAVNDRAGAGANDRSRALAARAALELGRIASRQTQAIALKAPLQQSLAQRKQSMQQALNWFDKAASYGYADVTTAATYETGLVYQTFGRALLDSERPKNLSALELDQYNLLLEEQADPFQEKAISTYEDNLRRISQGVYDEWVAKSAAQLATLAPAQYQKHERGQDYDDRLK
ncbi:tetratricopeptide repeat protein [Solimonas sp. C16B3]|uniref:Tetratricopeptide repeat protein n=2 Tax=Solimonas marina TaxID=2714601 RepID=A0A969WEA4_9GAMM|nr:tetratricopeptide repeat protein [Solimonas marina]NKF23776.1 tetratricopeptide repeat protein [Solimonas marina]